MALTEADIIRLDLGEHYIKTEEITYENMGEAFWQNKYITAMKTIENQNAYIEYLKERLEKYD